jgi:hypothetical protein
MRVAIPPLPNTPSWRGEHRDIFTFTFVFAKQLCRLPVVGDYVTPLRKTIGVHDHCQVINDYYYRLVGIVGKENEVNQNASSLTSRIAPECEIILDVRLLKYNRMHVKIFWVVAQKTMT